MHRRVRIDMRAEYFIRQYRLDCACLRLQTQLYKILVDRHVSLFDIFFFRLIPKYKYSQFFHVPKGFARSINSGEPISYEFLVDSGTKRIYQESLFNFAKRRGWKWNTIQSNTKNANRC